MCEEPGYGRCIEMKEYPNGYCIYVFRILGRVGGDVVNQKKCGHTRINLKFPKALSEYATVLLYASFPAKVRVDAARNILLKFYKREEQVLKMSHLRWIRNISCYSFGYPGFIANLAVNQRCVDATSL